MYCVLHTMSGIQMLSYEYKEFNIVHSIRNECVCKLSVCSYDVIKKEKVTIFFCRDDLSPQVAPVAVTAAHNC